MGSRPRTAERTSLHLRQFAATAKDRRSARVRESRARPASTRSRQTAARRRLTPHPSRCRPGAPSVAPRRRRPGRHGEVARRHLCRLRLLSLPLLRPSRRPPHPMRGAPAPSSETAPQARPSAPFRLVWRDASDHRRPLVRALRAKRLRHQRRQADQASPTRSDEPVDQAPLHPRVHRRPRHLRASGRSRDAEVLRSPTAFETGEPHSRSFSG